jgi:hypothetical protein
VLRCDQLDHLQPSQLFRAHRQSRFHRLTFSLIAYPLTLSLNNGRGAALAPDGLGWAAAAFGDFSRVRKLYESALRRHGELRTMGTAEAADVLAHWGMVEYMAGAPEQAEPLLASR